VAIVKRTTSSEYQVTMTGTELALIRSALGEAERVCRLRMEVLDEEGRSQHGDSAEKCSPHHKIDGLAMREASLRWLRKTVSEVDHGGNATPSQHAALGQRRSAARLPVPPPRRHPDAFSR